MKSPSALIRLYLDELWIHLSIIRPSSEGSTSTLKTTINRTYLLTFLAYIIVNVYGTIGLHYESGSRLLLSSLRQSKFIYWHQFIPHQVWLQMDIVISMVVLVSLFLQLNFALKQVKWRHLFIIGPNVYTVKLNGKNIIVYEATKLVSVFHRSKLLYKIFGVVLYTLALSYCNVMVFLVSKVYCVSFWSITFWVLGFPFILLFYVLFVMVNLIHIIVSGCCIQTRQQYICQQFSRLLVKLDQSHPSVRQFGRIWLCYQTFNRIVLSIGIQLEAFNAFYTNYLTLTFLQYTIALVLLAYIVFFAPVSSAGIVALKCLLFVASIEMTTLLFGLIEFCALVVKKNSQIGRLNRRFAVHCLQNQTIYRLPTRQLLKIEQLQWPRLLHFYAFKVFGGSRITSKTFYAMAINISGFFLFVMKRIQY